MYLRGRLLSGENNKSDKIHVGTFNAFYHAGFRVSRMSGLFPGQPHQKILARLANMNQIILLGVPSIEPAFCAVSETAAS